MQIKLTFKNDPARNGSSVAWPGSERVALSAIREWLVVASRRDTPTTCH